MEQNLFILIFNILHFALKYLKIILKKSFHSFYDVRINCLSDSHPIINQQVIINLPSSLL